VFAAVPAPRPGPVLFSHQHRIAHRRAQRIGKRLCLPARGLGGKHATPLQSLQRLVRHAEAGYGEHAISHQVIRITLQHFFGRNDRTRVIPLVELQLRDTHPRLLARWIRLRRIFECLDRCIRADRCDLCLGIRHGRFEWHCDRLLRCGRTRSKTGQQNQCHHRPIGDRAYCLHIHRDPSLRKFL